MQMLLNILKQEYISNIYIGVTAILVAIVIFIAEIIKDQKNELNKKVILDKTHIKENIIDVLMIFFYMLIVNMLGYNENAKDLFWDNIWYFITHTFLLIFVIMYTYKTGRMFLITLKLNTEKDYFNKELEKYIYEKALRLEKTANKKFNKKHKKEEKEFNEFIKEQDIYFKDESIIKGNSNYEAIYPIKNGILGTYDYDKLKELANYFTIQKNAKENYDGNNNIVFIPNNIGKKVSKKEPVFYCLKEYINIFKNLSNMVIYKDNRLFIEDEIKLINRCLFELALEYEEPDTYDENNRLFNYFKYLYDNKLYGIKSLALNNIEEIYGKIYKNFSKNRQFSRFLNSLSYLAYSNGDYEDYEYINKIELYLYIHQLKTEKVDIKEVAYNFANNVVRFNLYSAKKNSDIRYYDNLMAMLLKFMVYLIKLSNFDAINVLLDNISMEILNYKDNDFDKYDIINFQFSCGIVYCLIIMSEQNKLNDECLETVKRLINYLHTYLVNLYDAWITIQCFKKYFEQKTCVQKVYDNLNLEFIEHKYKNSWGGWGINTKIILKEFLYIFNINFVNINDIDKEKINRNDTYYFEDLLKLVNGNEYTNLDIYLNVKYNKSDVSETLNIAIEEAKRKEKEFNRVNKLNKNKVEKFKELIKQNIKKDFNFYNDLKKYNKIKNSNIKLNKVFGINQLIPREIFFDDIGGYETIAKDYCGTLNIGVEKEYIKKIDIMSQKSSDDLENVLYSINNLQDYVIISNYLSKSDFNKLDYDYQNNMIICKDKKIPIINTPQIDAIYLVKQSDLPIINFCSYDDEWDSECIDGSLFYELIDCSENENIRKFIINNSNWIKEKGTTEEQENYLKECCRIRLFLAYSITKDKGASALKFEYKKM